MNSYGAATSPNGTQVPSLSALTSTQNKQPAVQPNRNNNSFRNSLGGNHSDLSNWLLPSKPKQKGPSLAQRQQLGSAVGGVLGKDVVSVDQHGTVTLSDGTQVPFIGSFPSSPSQPNSNKVVPSQNNNQPPADIKPPSPFGSPYGSGNGVVSPGLADWILPARPKNNSVANSNPQNNNSVASNNSVSPKDRTVPAGGNNAVNASVNNANSIQPSNNTQGSQNQQQKGPSLAQRQQLGSVVGGVLGKDVVNVDQYGTVTLSDGTQVPFIGSFPSSPSQPNSNKVVPSRNNNQPPADIKPISPFGSPYGSGNGVVSPDLADWILPARPKNNSVANSNPQNNNSVASNNSVSSKDQTVPAGGSNAVNVSVNNANSVQPSNNTQVSQSQPSSNKISNASANAQPLSSQPNNNKNFDPIDDQEVAPDYLEETIDLKNLGAEWDGVVKDLEAQNASQDFAEETIDLNNLGQEWDGVAKDLEAQNTSPDYPEETIDLNDLGVEWDGVVKDLEAQNASPSYPEETINLKNLGTEWDGVNKDVEAQNASPSYPEETIDLKNLGTEWDGVNKDVEAQNAAPSYPEETIDLNNLGQEWDDVAKDLEAQKVAPDYPEETIDLNNLGAEWDGVNKDLEAQNVAPSYQEETIDLNNLGAEWDGVNKDLEAQNAAPSYPEETIDLNNLGAEWDDVNKDLGTQNVAPDYAEETIDLNNLGPEWNGVNKDLESQKVSPDYPEETIDLNNLGQEWYGVLKDLNQQVQKPQHDIDQQSDVKHNQDHKQNVGNSEKPLDDNLLEDGNSSNSQELPNDNQQQSGNQLPKIKNMKPEGNPQVDTKKPQNMSIQDGQNKVVELPKDASSKAAINSKANPSDNNVNKDGKLAVDQSEANKVINSDSRVAKTKSIIQLTPIVTNVKKAQNVVTANNKVHTATTQKMQKVKASTSTTKNKQHKANKQLPKTGESTPATTPILGAVLSLLGTLTLIGRRKKQQD